MGQSDVIDFLKKKKDWVTTKEISEAINCNISLVGRTLRILLKYREVRRKIKLGQPNKFKIHPNYEGSN